jgi:hypothetical protein
MTLLVFMVSTYMEYPKCMDLTWRDGTLIKAAIIVAVRKRDQLNISGTAITLRWQFSL